MRLSNVLYNIICSRALTLCAYLISFFFSTCFVREMLLEEILRKNVYDIWAVEWVKSFPTPTYVLYSKTDFSCQLMKLVVIKTKSIFNA